MRNVRLLFLAVAAAVSVVGCDSTAPEDQPPPPPPSPLTVAPSVATLNGGQVIRLVASLHLANGSTATPDNIAWSSADVSIATVDHTGAVHALRSGRVQIIASWHDSRGSSLILVANPVAKKPQQCLDQLRAGTESSIPTNGPCA